MYLLVLFLEENIFTIHCTNFITRWHKTESLSKIPFRSQITTIKNPWGKRSITPRFSRNVQFQVKGCDVEENVTLGVFESKTPHTQSCCWDRMSASVGGDVGGLKPQQAGNSDRFTSPCSYTMDLTSCLPIYTETHQHGETNRPSQPPEQANSSTFSVTGSTCGYGRGKTQHVNVRRRYLTGY